MGIGILVCGSNGSGKSTVGKALAYELGYHFIDNEDLFFPKSDPNYPWPCEIKSREYGGRMVKVDKLSYYPCRWNEARWRKYKHDNSYH